MKCFLTKLGAIFFFFENVNNVVSSNLAGRDPIWHNGTNTIWALDGCVEFSGINK